MKNERKPLSVAIITYNEAEVIGRCLESVSFADEVVIVDSGSTDATVSIAEKFGAKAYYKEWRGFGKQKQFAVDQCRNAWVLILDADETIPPTTVECILHTMEDLKYKGYSFRRENYFNQKLIKHGSWGSDTVVRLFDKNYCHVSLDEVHEAVVCDYVGTIASPLHHFPRRNISAFLEKINLYSTLWSTNRKNRNADIISAMLHGGWSFAFNYFFRLGFLDGSEGALIAFSDMVETFFKYAKLWELSRNGSRPCRR